MLLLVLILILLRFSPEEPRRLNRFTWGPIAEVAIIFAGIFATMVPALAILEARADEIGLTAPWQFFWASGSLSSLPGRELVHRQRAQLHGQVDRRGAGRAHAVHYMGWSAAVLLTVFVLITVVFFL